MTKISIGLLFAMGVSMIMGSPVPAIETRTNHKMGPTDVDILNYALTLEHLEAAFYVQGLKKYKKTDFEALNTPFVKSDPSFYRNVKRIRDDELAHVDFIEAALKSVGAKAVAPCKYNFPHKNAAEFLAVAGILEGVGVSAYLGAAASIMEKAYLTAAGSILTVESRHSSYIRAAQKQTPFPSPFDTPLSLNQVFSLASSFIVSCPESNPPLPVKAFPPLGVMTSGPIHQGDEIVLTAAEDENPHNLPRYAAFITITGPVYVDAKPVHGGYKVKVPGGKKGALVIGQTYVVLTSCNVVAEGVTDENTVAGPAILEVMKKMKM